MKGPVKPRHYENNGLSDYIAVARYARYRYDLKRRETFEEAVGRVAAMHRRRFAAAGAGAGGDFAMVLARLRTLGEYSEEVLEWVERALRGKGLDELIEEAFAAVERKEVLPSMRSLQFGGEAIEAANARMFNCCFSALNRIDFFRELFYLLLAGCGCGFSVQRHHIAELPVLPERAADDALPVRCYTVEDSIEGWADALDELLRSFFNGYRVEYDLQKIRPRGAPLRVSGGVAPGPEPLRRCLDEVDRLLSRASGRRLKPIEAYDVCMFIARAVLAGGVRRSATICLFSPDDREMMNAKTGDWPVRNPQRSNSNNSAVIDRSAARWEEFGKLFEAQKEFGEPGFYFTDDPDYGTNPCGEIGLHPFVRGELSHSESEKLRACGYGGDLSGTVRLSGWQMCNLSTINAAAARSEEAVFRACVHAAAIGTLQAAYTDIPYLGPITRYLNEREAVLGVSICGILDNPDLFLDAAVLERGAAVCRAVNAAVAEAIGIRPAARVTCVKPEGTTSLLLGTGSGIHPHHARWYFRRVQNARNDPVYQHFHKVNPHMTEPSVYSPDTDDVITFPVEAPDGAVLRESIDALAFLEKVIFVQRHWVGAGFFHSDFSPGLQHNVSNTCTVKAGEWESVARFIWENRRFFTGVALLSEQGDKAYSQPPRETVVTAGDIEKWNRLEYRPVDYTELREGSDATSLRDVPACVGGGCEV